MDVDHGWCQHDSGEARVRPIEAADSVSRGGHRPIRVCLVAPSLDVPGGQSLQAARLYQGLRQVGSVVAGFVPINPRLPGPLRLLQRVRYLRTVVTSLRYVWTLLTSLANYDIVHVFSASYFSFILAPTPAILLGKWYGKRVILNYHSGEAEDHVRRWRRTALPVMRLADALIVPSRYLVDVFARVGLRACVVANGVDCDRFRFRERKPLRPVFLSNRNFEAHYNVACVLHAFARIQGRHPDARLLVAGDGSQRAALMRLARELHLRNAEFVGQVTPDAGGIPYIVRHGETGLIVSRGDHEAMGAAALRLLEDPPLAERLTARALEECRHTYAADAVVEEWRSVYEGLAAYAQAPTAELSARPDSLR